VILASDIPNAAEILMGATEQLTRGEGRDQQLTTKVWARE
jgi:hypothetical protein